MGLLSIFKRQADTSNGASAGGPPPDDVQRARTRARQRLIGAVVLVGIGIVGFPLVFETQPRPIPVDIPIEVPRKDGGPSLVMPGGRTSGPNSTGANSSASAVQVQPTPAAPSTTAPPAAPADVITETPEDVARDVAARDAAARTQAAGVAASAAAAAAARAESKSAAKPAPTPQPPAKPVAEAKPAVVETKPAAAEAKPVAAPKPAATVSDSARAKALLEGKAPAAAESGRFVVQVGAFTDASAAHETRLKAEKLGIKTYTQVVSTSAGSRIRVRLGPFSSRDEADSALSKARGAGLTAVVLTL